MRWTAAAATVAAVLLGWFLSATPQPSLPADVTISSAGAEDSFVAGLRILIGSCHKVSCATPAGETDKPTGANGTSRAGGCVAEKYYGELWPAILERAQGARAWVWAGDAVYADVRLSLHSAWSRGLLFKEAVGSWKLNPFEGASPERLVAHLGYLKDSAQYTQLQQVLLDSGDATAQTHIYGMYDDHDYGINDGNVNYAHRIASAQAFLDFLDEPDNSPRRSRAAAGGGIYTSHVIAGVSGQAGQSQQEGLKLILLDVRSNREPYDTVRAAPRSPPALLLLSCSPALAAPAFPAAAAAAAAAAGVLISSLYSWLTDYLVSYHIS